MYLGTGVGKLKVYGLASLASEINYLLTQAVK